MPSLQAAALRRFPGAQRKSEQATGRPQVNVFGGADWGTKDAHAGGSVGHPGINAPRNLAEYLREARHGAKGLENADRSDSPVKAPLR